MFEFTGNVIRVCGSVRQSVVLSRLKHATAALESLTSPDQSRLGGKDGECGGVSTPSCSHAGVNSGEHAQEWGQEKSPQKAHFTLNKRYFISVESTKHKRPGKCLPPTLQLRRLDKKTLTDYCNYSSRAF